MQEIALPTACVQAFLMHMEQQRKMRLGPEAAPMEEGAHSRALGQGEHPVLISGHLRNGPNYVEIPD